MNGKNDKKKFRERVWRCICKVRVCVNRESVHRVKVAEWRRGFEVGAARLNGARGGFAFFSSQKSGYNKNVWMSRLGNGKVGGGKETHMPTTHSYVDTHTHTHMVKRESEKTDG